jgi:peptidoglycan/LPS O-acetylase OafA/YrhL
VPHQRFVFVDGLRGIAAMWVVLFHSAAGGHIPGLLAAMPVWLAAVIKNGHLGVSIFFVLSGFVIAHSVYGERSTISFVARFMLRRSIRLDPPYWFAIALCIAFAVLSAVIVSDKSAPQLSWGQILAHVLYLQDLLSYPQINWVFWTLCIELQFYLVYVILLALARNNPDLPFQGRSTAVWLAAAAIVSLLWPTGFLTASPWPGSFLPLWYGFLLGVGAYWTWRNQTLLPYFVVFALTIAGAAALSGNMFALVCAATAFALWLAAVSSRMMMSLNWSWLQFLGLVSYSLYLTHNSITGATFRVGYMLTSRSMLWEAIWWMASIGASVAFAGLMWRVIEKPSMQLARKVRLKSYVVGGGERIDDGQPQDRRQLHANSLPVTSAKLT